MNVSSVQMCTQNTCPVIAGLFFKITYVIMKGPNKRSNLKKKNGKRHLSTSAGLCYSLSLSPSKITCTLDNMANHSFYLKRCKIKSNTHGAIHKC